MNGEQIYLEQMTREQMVESARSCCNGNIGCKGCYLEDKVDGYSGDCIKILLLQMANYIEQTDFICECQKCEHWKKIDSSKLGECLIHDSLTKPTAWCSYGKEVIE